MIEYLETLRDQLEAVAGTGCEPGRVTITAGEPPASTDCEPAIWLWPATLEDTNLDPKTCMVRTVATISYRIDVCYQTTEEDETDAIHLAAADCLAELMSNVWCGLVALKDTGDLMDLGTCEGVRFEPLTVGQRQGGTVSASGGVVFDYPC